MILLFSANSYSEIVEETGTLRGFLSGECDGIAYDNWLSHTAEGIARPGYNDYGPEFIDPQNSDFGNYRIIPEDSAGDSLLAYWQQIFQNFVNHNYDVVDQLLVDSLDSFNYELVFFHDTDYWRDYYIIRERLDSTYVDSSMTPDDTSDDVVGSFRNSWGVFVINNDAVLPNVFLQNVHPNDDFISTHFNIDLYLRINAGLLSIHGSGREVEWTEEGDYINGKSLSDPSRTGRAPIHVLQEVFTDYYFEDYPYSALIVQSHSFDLSNDILTPVILSAGYYWRKPYLPLFDNEYGGLDIIQNTSHPVFEENEYTVNGIRMPELPLDSYYALNLDVDLIYSFVADNEDVITIPHPSSHRGDPNNVQATHLHHVERYVADQSIEPFVHIELDEFPEIMSENNVTWEDLLIERHPVTWQNYSRILEFYEPFMVSMVEWFEWYSAPVLESNENSVDGLALLNHDENGFGIGWDGDKYGYHLGYEVLIDTLLDEQNSPVVLDWQDDRRLISSLFSDCTYVALPHQWGKQIGVRSVDLAGNRSDLSEFLQLNVSEKRLPEEYLLFNCWPNPFNSTLSLEINTINNEDGQLTIYDLLGRKVYTFILDDLHAGLNRILWKPENSIKSGTYFIVYRTQDSNIIRKVTLLK